MERRIFNAAQRGAWNAFIARSPYGHVLQSWEWGELKERTGQDAVRVALVDGDELRAAATILLRRLPSRLGTLAYVPKGPVLDYDDPSLLEQFLGTLQALAAERGVISLKIEPELTEPSPVVDRLLSAGLDASSPVQLRSTIWVDLRPTEEEMLAKQKQKTRYNIRLAAKKGVTVRCGGVEDVDAWYRMYAVTAERDGFTIHALEYYRSVVEILGGHGMAALLLAEHDGDLLAGIVAFHLGQTAQYMYGASSNVKRNLMAPYLLQWEGMRWAKSRGAEMYDLWGIPDEVAATLLPDSQQEPLDRSDGLWGVYRHKRGYGGDVVRYIGAFDLVRSPLRHFALERVARPLFDKAARFRARGTREQSARATYTRSGTPPRPGVAQVKAIQ